MSVFDIMGPVMVGPSSSHTAGAVRIGYIARKLLGEPPVSAEILMHGSFADTGKGHGTDRAIVAGLLGMKPDDERIPRSLAIAKEEKLALCFGEVELPACHPNTALIRAVGANGRKLEVIASSLGGGKVKILQVDGLDANITGEYPTLIIHNQDQPGHVAEVTSVLSFRAINIATMQLYRDIRGGYAVMVLETDEPVPPEILTLLTRIDGILKVTYLNIDKE